MIDTSALEFVICPICPGNMKIFPPSALIKHNETAHSALTAMTECVDCGRLFEVVVSSRRCAVCRQKKKKRPPGVRRRQMSSTGVEKDISIAQRCGVKR